MPGADLEISSPGEFAREFLHPRALARRYLVSTESDSHVLSDYESYEVKHGYGGWPEYHNAEIENEEPLSQTPHTGRRDDHMTRQELSGVDDTAGAYVTNYAGSDPNLRQAHSQMAVWAFCDSLGLEVPRHHWFPENHTVVVEEVGGPQESVQDPIAVAPDAASQVNKDALLEYISVLLLAGTADLRPKNFMIGEEGQVYVFDFDKSDHKFVSVEALKGACMKAMQTINTLDCVRDVEIGVNKGLICARVQELATTIDMSQHRERILETVALYDDLFSETDENFEQLIGKNIDVFSEAE